MRRRLLALMALVIASGAPIRNAQAEAFSFEPLNQTLAAHVNAEGLVDYSGLKTDHAPLDAFLESIAKLERAQYEMWPDPQKIAFWINAYNAIVLRLVITHYPLTGGGFTSLLYPEASVRRIPHAFTRQDWTVMGENISLDAILHDILRREWDEPRIHAALVRGTMSCPPLRREAYDGQRLDEQLSDQMRRFARENNALSIERDTGQVRLSKIIDWHGVDFVRSYGTRDRFAGAPNERAFLNAIVPVLDESDRAFLETGRYTVSYFEHDWTLNDQLLKK